MAHIQDTMVKDSSAARKKLLVDLTAAQDAAMKANDLDDALSIRDVRNEYDDPNAPVAKTSSKSDQIQVISAFYGQNVSWIDTTDKVIKAAEGKTKWAATIDSRELGEPAPGWNGTRTLLFRYAIDGKTYFKSAYEGSAIVIP